MKQPEVDIVHCDKYDWLPWIKVFKETIFPAKSSISI